MPEVNRRWVYPTITASENKGIERIALTGEGTAHEVVGVDGSRRFGCRPSSGFRLAHTLNVYQNFQGSNAANPDASRPFSDKAPPTQTKASTVTDCFPVNFQIREGEFAHGFVYRVQGAGTATSAIFMDYCPTNTVDGATGWRTVLISDHKTPGVDSTNHVSPTAKMDVVSMGKYVFVLVQGRKPRVFYIEYDSVGTKATATFTFGSSEFNTTADATLKLIDSQGTEKTYQIRASSASGVQFLRGANATECATNFKTVVEGTFGHNGTITVLANQVSATDSTTAAGKIILTQATKGTGGNTAIASPSGDWNDNTSVNVGSAFSGGGTGAATYSHKIVNGGPGARPKVRNFGSDYNFPEKLYELNNVDGSPGNDDNTYGRYQQSVVTSETVPYGELIESAAGSDPGHASDEVIFHKFAAGGDYSFAYYLYDSETGRRTALCDVVSRGEKQNNKLAAEKFIGFAVEVDTEKYDQIYIFRSVRQQSAGGVYSGTLLHLDTIYNISDSEPLGAVTAAYKGITELQSHLNPDYGDGNSTGWKVFNVWYQLDDISLAMQDMYLDKTIIEDEMPYAASGVPFDGSLIVCDPQGETTLLSDNLDSKTRNIGEIRWSSLTERSPELFPINNKYSPDVYQNRVEHLSKAGEFAVGFSSDRLYHIRRNGIYLKIEDMHAGFGLASENGYASAGPLCYFITSKGLKAIANNGQLDDVQALDNLLLEDWYSDLSSVRLSFDPYASCLFILNPVKEQTVCMWFGTGRITELHDTDFTDIRSGIWPQTYTRNSYDDTTPTTTTTTSMVERTFFLQNHPQAGSLSNNITANWRPRVYIHDLDRDKVTVNSTDLSAGQPMLRTLDCTGDSIFTVHTSVAGSGVTVLTLKSGGTGTKNLSTTGGSGWELAGAKVYVISSDASTRVGTKATIVTCGKGTVTADGAGSQTITVDGDVSALIQRNDVIAVSPVLFRYVGGALPMVRTEDMKVLTRFDLFQNKQVSSIGCHFTDVSGGVANYKFFRGLVYNSESDSVAVTAFPTNFSGEIIGDSVRNGESDDYAAFTTTGLTTKGKHGIQDSALNPGIEVFSPDLDFKLMAVICRGRSTNTDTSDRNTT